MPFRNCGEYALRDLSDRQCGLRKARSAIDANKLMSGLPENSIHRKGSISKSCVVVIQDVRNALDSTNWIFTLPAIVDRYLQERRFWYDTDERPKEYVVSNMLEIYLNKLIVAIQNLVL